MNTKSRKIGVLSLSEAGVSDGAIICCRRLVAKIPAFITKAQNFWSHGIFTTVIQGTDACSSL